MRTHIYTAIAITSVLAVPAMAASGGASAHRHPRLPACGVSTAYLANGMSQTCRFTATMPGGFVYDYQFHAGLTGGESAKILVVRNGRTIYARSWAPGPGGGCAHNIIRPGDRVTISVHQDSPLIRLYRDVGVGGGYDPAVLAAGKGFGCRTPLP